jgi:multidrug efflux pump subunit AcrB
MKLYGVLLFAFLVCVVFAYQQTTGSALPQPALTPDAQASPTPPESATQETNDRFVQQILERIKGHENDPAEQVFKNIQRFKGLPAGRLLRIMNGGYSRALGVTCTHCHVEEDFASEDKRPKRAAREMATMHRSINEQLGKMQNLASKPEQRAINCSTCHRGAIDPMATSR